MSPEGLLSVENAHEALPLRDKFKERIKDFIASILYIHVVGYNNALHPCVITFDVFVLHERTMNVE